MESKPDVPMDSDERRYPKRDLPEALSSTYAHGHISGHPRSPQTQRVFEARKATILRTMNGEQIESAYQDHVQQIRTILEEDRKKTDEIERELGKLRAQRDLETKIFHKQRESRLQQAESKDEAVLEDVEMT